MLNLASSKTEMQIINNEEVSPPTSQYVSQNDAYFLLWKLPVECRDGQSEPNFPFFQTSQNNEGQIILPISQMQRTDEMDIDLDESDDEKAITVDEVDEDGDVQMLDVLPSVDNGRSRDSDIRALQKMVGSTDYIPSMPDIFVETVKSALLNSLFTYEIEVGDTVDDFLEIDEFKEFSKEFKETLGKTLKQNLPEKLTRDESDETGWAQLANVAFRQFDDLYFPSISGICRKRYEKFHKKMQKTLPILIKNNNILSDKYISVIRKLILENKTSQKNKERIQTLMDTLQKDGYKTHFGNICFQSAEDDRYRPEVALHFSYTKCQNLTSMDHGTATFLSVAQNAVQGTATYSLLSSNIFHSDALGISLAHFECLFELLVLNKNQSASQLAKYCGISSDMTIPRKVGRKRKKGGDVDGNSEGESDELGDLDVGSAAKDKGDDGKEGEGKGEGEGGDSGENAREGSAKWDGHLFPVKLYARKLKRNIQKNT